MVIYNLEQYLSLGNTMLNALKNLSTVLTRFKKHNEGFLVGKEAGIQKITIGG